MVNGKEKLIVAIDTNEFDKAKELIDKLEDSVDIFKVGLEQYVATRGKTVDYLKEKGIPFTIASASIKENIDFFIESFGLDRWIKPEDIIYDDGTYENKIAMFHKAADVIGVDMKDIRIYEDSNSGLKNAYDAGCRQIVAICDKEKEEEFLKRPGVIKTMQDFSFAKEL